MPFLFSNVHMKQKRLIKYHVLFYVIFLILFNPVTKRPAVFQVFSVFGLDYLFADNEQ